MTKLSLLDRTRRQQNFHSHSANSSASHLFIDTESKMGKEGGYLNMLRGSVMRQWLWLERKWDWQRYQLLRRSQLCKKKIGRRIKIRLSTTTRNSLRSSRITRCTRINRNMQRQFKGSLKITKRQRRRDSKEITKMHGLLRKESLRR